MAAAFNKFRGLMQLFYHRKVNKPPTLSDPRLQPQRGHVPMRLPPRHANRVKKWAGERRQIDGNDVLEIQNKSCRGPGGFDVVVLCRRRRGADHTAGTS
jgi:hypothetical protein